MSENIKNKTIILLIIMCNFFCSNSVFAQSSKALETIFAIEALDLATAHLKNAKNVGENFLKVENRQKIVENGHFLTIFQLLKNFFLHF